MNFIKITVNFNQIYLCQMSLLEFKLIKKENHCIKIKIKQKLLSKCKKMRIMHRRFCLNHNWMGSLIEIILNHWRIKKKFYK